MPVNPKEPAKESLRQKINRLVREDLITIADEQNFYRKWGEYPAGKKKRRQGFLPKQTAQNSP